jgi:hypothetical protein
VPTSAELEPEQIFEDESSTETESSDDETDEPKPGYVGDMVDGKKHGEGTYTWKDGTVYVGSWVDGKKHGEGTITYKDGRLKYGRLKYVGIWANGKKNGEGTFTYENGATYVGTFVDGKRHGEGTYTSGGAQYVGSYVNNKRHGLGTETKTAQFFERFFGRFGSVSSDFSVEALHSAHLSPPFVAPMALLR